MNPLWSPKWVHIAHMNRATRHTTHDSDCLPPQETQPRKPFNTMSKRELEGDTDETGAEQPAVVNEDSDPAAKRPALEQPPPQDFSNFKIFVGGVDRGVDTAQFTAHFAQFGTVVDSVVMKVRNRQACLLACLANCTPPPSYFPSSFAC